MMKSKEKNVHLSKLFPYHINSLIKNDFGIVICTFYKIH